MRACSPYELSLRLFVKVGMLNVWMLLSLPVHILHMLAGQ